MPRFHSKKYLTNSAFIYIFLLAIFFCHSNVHAMTSGTVDNITDAASYIRNQMFDHQTKVTLYYQSEELQKVVENKLDPIENDINRGEYFSTFYHKLCNEIYNCNIMDPRAGDYLADTTTLNFPNYKIYSPEEHIVEIVYNISYEMTDAEEHIVSSRINTILSDLSISSRSDPDKIRTIYDYVCKNVRYEEGKITAYSALEDHTANCRGYATLLYRMLLSSGIKSRIIHGKTEENVSHVWNIVQYNGFWYSLDATYDHWETTNGKYAFFLRPGIAFNNDGLTDRTRDSSYQGSFYDFYPMYVPSSSPVQKKVLPSISCKVKKKVSTVKYNSLKKKNVKIMPLSIRSSAKIPWNCKIVSSKYRKYFSIDKKTGKITVKKISKKNKPKRMTYTIRVCIQTEATAPYYGVGPIYKSLKVKIK